MSLEPSRADRPGSRPLSATLERLEAHTPDEARYELEGEIARGGMGIVQRVWDGDLRRSVARKILGRDAQGSDSRKSDPRTVGRFLEEAQVTAQLEHPGIVPVHELGVDRRGTLYFTMRMVRGEDLHRIFAHARAGEHGWNQTRALNVLLKVCEAMAFAHKKGVVHRDLKPSNVMVGRFGETYVMDWGLARVLALPDSRDVRLQADPISAEVRTDRRAEVDTPDSPLLTRDGDVVGTPAYMSPEQARGDLACIGPATDVYALGAMLYHLLSGRVPYTEPERKLAPQSILSLVLLGPPAPIESLAPAAPPELLAICEKAMARELAERYASMHELAEDLRAYLELRVVRAYRTGPGVELVKWVRRNRLSAASLAALVLVVMAAALGIALLESNRRREQEGRLAAAAVTSLVARIDDLWPIHPQRAPAMRAWLDEARHWVALLPAAREKRSDFEHEHSAAARVEDAVEPQGEADEFTVRSLESLHGTLAKRLNFLVSGNPEDADPKNMANELAFRDSNLGVLQREVPRLERELTRKKGERDRKRSWHYEEAALEGTYEQLHRFVGELEALASSPDGGIATIEARLQLTTDVERACDEHAEEWRAAAESISDRSRCPAYGGLHLAPQVGLLPIGRDPQSGLWEFWHVSSGARPERDAAGNWSITPDTGIVLVLVPGGSFIMGSQDEDPGGPNYFAAEPGIDKGLRPVDDWQSEVTLDAYFLSKYELTQGQWLRMAGTQPSTWFAGSSWRDMARVSLTHPVESVSWFDAARTLWRYDLSLPTEAQWERAARAGSQWKYISGETVDTVLPLANFADRKWDAVRPGEGDGHSDDGWAIHAPVDAFPPSAWGLHSIVGNVAEWCFDWYGSSCERGSFSPGTGEHVPKTSTEKTYRGGSLALLPNELWASSRHGMAPSSNQYDLGVRAARRLDPVSN